MKTIVTIFLLLISLASFAQGTSVKSEKPHPVPVIDTVNISSASMEQLKAIEKEQAELTPERVEARKQELSRVQGVIINTFLDARGKALKQGDSLSFKAPNTFVIKRKH